MKSLTKLTAAVLLSSFVFAGCYGKFALTRKVYEVNGKITDNKFVHSLATWVFLILPVYSIAGFADFVVLNTIEFWTGKNPMGASNTTIEDGVKVTATTGENEVAFAYEKDGQLLQTVTVSKPVGDVATAKVYNSQGEFVSESAVAVAQ